MLQQLVMLPVLDYSPAKTLHYHPDKNEDAGTTDEEGDKGGFMSVAEYYQIHEHQDQHAGGRSQQRHCQIDQRWRPVAVHVPAEDDVGFECLIYF